MNEDRFTIHNGDCFLIMEELIRQKIQVDAVICDPPYNIDIANWDNNFDIERALKLCYQLLKDNGNIIIFQGWSEVCKTKSIMDNLFTPMNWIIWDRIKGRGATKNFVSTREDILWYCKGENPTYHKMYSNIEKKTAGMGSKNGETTRALTNVWYDISPIVPWSSEKTEHPSQKPVELIERCVNIWTNPNDTVLDFTMGTGTTGRACLNLGRKFIGIEQDNKWFNIAQSRLSEEQIVEDKDDTLEGYDF
jgi:site-specific DNA-methyltransferase (adenine-specific)